MLNYSTRQSDDQSLSAAKPSQQLWTSAACPTVDHDTRPEYDLSSSGRPPLSPSCVGIMAAAGGIAVANLYYNQPMLPDIGRSFGVAANVIALLPMLAQIGYALDGERCLAFRSARDLNLFSRNRIRLNAKYPEVVEAIDQQKTTSFVADGEIVTFEDGISSFAKLQPRMQVEHPSADLIRKAPVWFYLFDLLYLDRYDIRQVTLRYRKELLRNAFDFQGSLRFTEHCRTEGEVYYRGACRKGWEGVIAKNGNSVYVSRRTRDWLKFKCKRAQEFVVGGYSDPRGSRDGFGALLLGYHRRGKLVFAGKVGTGFDRDLLRRLSEKLARLKITVSPFAEDGLPRHGVKPKLVAQIRFSEWTAGGKLRHPRFLGLRNDKRLEDVVREG